MQELAYWVALNQIKDIGPVRFSRLYEKYGSIEKVFNFRAEDLRGLKLNEEKIGEIIKWRDSLSPEQVLSKVLVQGIKPITIFSEEYPEQLKHIYAPPYMLYALGNMELLKRPEWLAVVGTRKPTFYGIKMTVSLTQDLVQKGWGIVSGMAKGIDAKAHEAALINNGKTIAVLGCGIDIIYPYENKRLYKEIMEKGLIISEMPLGAEPQPFQFPLRNRIITGLSKGTLVIEGDYKSGAMISGKLALDQNREVFALPGRATDMMSNGPNWLIKQGAKLVLSAEDILEEFTDIKRKRVPPSQWTGQTPKQLEILPKKAPISLSEKEKKVYKELSEIDSQNIEYLSEKTGIAMTELMIILSSLEINGVVKQLPGKQFLLI